MSLILPVKSSNVVFALSGGIVSIPFLKSSNLLFTAVFISSSVASGPRRLFVPNTLSKFALNAGSPNFVCKALVTSSILVIFSPSTLFFSISATACCRSAAFPLSDVCAALEFNGCISLVIGTPSAAASAANMSDLDCPFLSIDVFKGIDSRIVGSGFGFGLVPVKFLNLSVGISKLRGAFTPPPSKKNLFLFNDLDIFLIFP